MRQSMTIRLDQDLLSKAKSCAVSENRTLTNYIETLILKDVNASLHKPTEVVAEEPLTVFMPNPRDQRLLTQPREDDSPQDQAKRQAYLDLISGWNA